jgi:hypothetical protein
VEAEIPKYKTPAHHLAANKRWRQKNPKRMQEYAVAWVRRNPAKYICNTARKRAEKKGIPFSITPSDIIIPDVCPVFGFPLVLSVGKGDKPGGKYNSPSLDRIVPELGYVPGNVRVISFLANTMKGAATPEQLRQFAEWVLTQ